MTATTLLLDATIHTGANPPGAGVATAMAVRDGDIAWVGPTSDGAARFPDARRIPLDGALVTPAFVDAHVHATSAGLQLSGADLGSARSLAEFLALVASSGPGPVLGHGWDETAWPERRPPTRAELDAAVGDRLAYLSRIDVHSALVTTALAIAVPEAVAEDGWSLDGPVSRAAHHVVRRAALGGIDPTRRRDAQLAFLRHAASMGVACVHECGGPDISAAEDFTELLADDPALPLVIGYWGELTGTEVAARLGARGLAGDLFVDGALGSRTAALCEPYLDADTSGALYLDADRIAAHVVACTRAGIQAGFHVIGDAAVAAVIEGFAGAERQVGTAALVAARHRLEHLEMVDAGQAARLGRWGVVASVQPLFDATWGGRDGMYAERLGPDRGAALNPFAHLAAAGVTLALGSDAPVTPVDPWGAVRAAVHHRTDGFGIGVADAFTAHTRGGWLAAGAAADDPVGTLVPGAPATYAVWDATDGLPDLDPTGELPRCLRTVRAGTTIHDSGELR